VNGTSLAPPGVGRTMASSRPWRSDQREAERPSDRRDGATPAAAVIRLTPLLRTRERSVRATTVPAEGAVSDAAERRLRLRIEEVEAAGLDAEHRGVARCELHVGGGHRDELRVVGDRETDQRLAAEHLHVLDTALDGPDEVLLLTPEPRVLRPHSYLDLGGDPFVGNALQLDANLASHEHPMTALGVDRHLREAHRRAADEPRDEHVR